MSDIPPTYDELVASVAAMQDQLASLPDLSLVDPSALTNFVSGSGFDASGLLMQHSVTVDSMAVPLPWIAPTLVNAWAVVGGRAVGYFKDAVGMVRLRGTLGGGASATTAFTLPAGYRPGQFSSFVGQPAGTFNAGLVNIDTAGVVTIYFSGATSVAVDGITFYAEN